MDPRDRIVGNIQLDKSRIERKTDLVFFCGGYMDEQVAEPYHSLRHSIYAYLSIKHPPLFTKLLVAEEILEWDYTETYKDLIELETHLACLSDLIILFVESPGSIAELGTFCVIPEISDKLTAYVQAKYDNKKTYIDLGPIKRLNVNEKSTVSVYPWDFRLHKGTDNKYLVLSEMTKDVVELVCEEINQTITEQTQRLTFRRDNEGHIMLLIVDLINLFITLKLREIRNYLSLHDINIEDSLLKQYLYILEKLEFICKHKYSTEHYYFSHDKKGGKYLEYHYLRPGADRLRSSGESYEYYQENDKKRMLAIRDFGSKNA